MRAEKAWHEQHVNVLFDVNRDGRLTRVNETEPDGAPPRLFFARGRLSQLVRFRADVPPRVVPDLQRAIDDMPTWDGRQPDVGAYDVLRNAVRLSGDIVEESSGPALRFPAAFGGDASADYA